MLAVVTCHFNWQGYHTPARNLCRFLRHMMEFKVPVYGIELHLKGRMALMRNNPNWRVIEVGPEAILFQKERLLNMAVKELVPQGYDHIACLDHDISFMNRDWIRDSEVMLEKFQVGQPFDNCWWVNRWGMRHQNRACCCKTGLDSGWKGHPGFGWLMRRDFFDIGFYEYALLGSGDTVSALAILNQALFGPTIEGVGLPQHQNGILAGYFSRMEDWNHGKVGWIPGEVFHEWHGDYADRAYAGRSVILREFDAQKHVVLNQDRIWTWTPAAPEEMIQATTQHFADRKEDG